VRETVRTCHRICSSPALVDWRTRAVRGSGLAHLSSTAVRAGEDSGSGRGSQSVMCTSMSHHVPQPSPWPSASVRDELCTSILLGAARHWCRLAHLKSPRHCALCLARRRTSERRTAQNQSHHRAVGAAVQCSDRHTHHLVKQPRSLRVVSCHVVSCRVF